MKLKGLLAGSLLLAAAFASADTVTYTFNVNGYTSYDSYADPANDTAILDLQTLIPGYESFTLNGIGWNVGIQTFGNSYQSEAIVSFEAELPVADDYIDTIPGLDADAPGNSMFNSGGILALNDPRLNISTGSEAGLDVSATDLLYVHFWDTFPDNNGAGDANWSGNFTLQFEATPTAVPEPATMAALGLGVAAMLRRRKK